MIPVHSLRFVLHLSLYPSVNGSMRETDSALHTHAHKHQHTPVLVWLIHILAFYFLSALLYLLKKPWLNHRESDKAGQIIYFWPFIMIFRDVSAPIEPLNDRITSYTSSALHLDYFICPACCIIKASQRLMLHLDGLSCCLGCESIRWWMIKRTVSSLPAVLLHFVSASLWLQVD